MKSLPKAMTSPRPSARAFSAFARSQAAGSIIVP
jgi:hypothetical protein